MDPLLRLIVRDLAHGEGRSAQPGAPVLDDAPRAAGLRRHVGTALHHLAARIEPAEPTRVEKARYRTA
jgi:hypothetical protein